ncbi:ATP-binding protein [Fusobacterium sp.]|uniref:ATP-binding protein n=1 Tax=Fusobacterium sp. TaxID=68766 RepID=UPI001DA9C2C9|nr:ATP-binding protein [Fusobacterium sp.]MBS5790702.1 ATP-binding protein [Fusobacterium sp.]MDY3059211.1 ATP-binding protein [Fusobacterium sp.]
MEIKEIVVISGKGGTGKTTITSSLIPYFQDIVIGDCDVDAPNLQILFNPQNSKKESFYGMKKAKLDKELCIECGRCYEVCRFDAVENPKKCESCSICEYVCPVGAIKMVDNEAGEIYVSETKYGKMVHACLFPGEENSGKLVAEVRKKAKKIAQEENKKYILLDGAPGVACNVISSLTGVKKAVIVTEPTLSGLHDLERVLELIERFRIKPYFVINKYDLSLEMANKIEEFLKDKGFEVSVKVPFDKRVVNAIGRKEIPSVAEKELFQKLGFEKLAESLKN